MKVSCIILNYNDAQTTKKLVESVKDYEGLDSVIMVDNHSTDDSASQLKALEGGMVHFLLAPRNGGYGYGNNMGIRYAYETLHATHVLIANPDVSFSEDCLKAMKDRFLREEKLAVAAAVTRDGTGNAVLSSWRLNGLLFDLLDTGLVTRRIFGRWLNDRFHFPYDSGSYAYVDAVMGSLFLADAKVLMECGLYDENVFLYYEEKILGHKLKEKGYKTVLLLDQSYLHLHSVSIKKSVESILKRQAILHKSKLYYYKNYLGINRLQEMGVRLFLEIIMMEIWFLTKMLGMSW
ncbi:glycosyltransferase [Clostridium sp. HBUAS56010]|uniref:glycosyltransferase family 2 protein n=1 Tax=Clostridium sp. HBUAS56010 TaxID=2571127 RepID=UPI00163DB210|nr:glycosyltransferase [Clostridium sp. HBUAS56010]